MSQLIEWECPESCDDCKYYDDVVMDECMAVMSPNITITNPDPPGEWLTLRDVDGLFDSLGITMVSCEACGGTGCVECGTTGVATYYKCRACDGVGCIDCKQTGQMTWAEYNRWLLVRFVGKVQIENQSRGRTRTIMGYYPENDVEVGGTFCDVHVWLGKDREHEFVINRHLMKRIIELYCANENKGVGFEKQRAELKEFDLESRQIFEEAVRKGEDARSAA